MTSQKINSYQFDDFQIDVAKRRLLRNGVVVAIKPKAFDLLAVLVENNGELLTKDDLFSLVWGDQVVEEANLTVSISAIRRALGEKASDPKYITNVSGRGYYFNAELRPLNANGHITDKPADSNNIKISKSVSNEAIERIPEPVRNWHKSASVAAVVVLLIAIAVTSYFLIARKSEAVTTGFGALSVNKLTTTGRAQTAAISPDGRMFAFTQLEPDGKQSLWLSQVDGGGQIQLRPASDRPLCAVAFAPDASKVYYVQFESNRFNRGTLYRLPAIGGTPEKIHENVSNRPAFSPDGRQFAYLGVDASSNRTSIVIARIDGSGESEIAAMAADRGRFSSALSWSPNGRTIAFAAITNEKNRGAFGIFTIDAEGGEMTPATAQEWSTVNSIGWTKGADSLIATASQTANESENQVWSIALPSGDVQRLLADSSSYLFLDLAAANSKILAIQLQSLSNVWVAPADDLTAAKQVTFEMMGKQAGWYGLDWTTDGKLIYTARLGKSDSIWEMNADGSGQTAIFPESGVNNYPSLPDDGSFVVFCSNRSGRTEIWRANRDGTDPVQLTRGGDNENPHVSPGGEFIVYKSGRKTEERLSLIPAKGGEPVTLTDKVSDFPRFSPDGKMIACQFDVGGKAELAVISISGGEPFKIFDVPPTANFRLGVHWTPDGKALTYRDWQNGIWKQSIGGGEPERLAGLPAEKLFAYAWSRDGRSFAFTRGTAINDVVLLSSLK